MALRRTLRETQVRDTLLVESVYARLAGQRRALFLVANSSSRLLYLESLKRAHDSGERETNTAR